jgi:transcriptional regulator with XRE-family HTH domain
MEHIVSARKALGLTQKKLADDLGISQASISAIESGRRTTRLLVYRIETRLGVAHQSDAKKRQIEILRINNNIVSMSLQDLMLVQQITQRMK